jgi:hypothetical protein
MTSTIAKNADGIQHRQVGRAVMDSDSGVFPGADIAGRNDGGLRIERTAAAADVDTATRQTVEKMCGYIAASIPDPLVMRCAGYAWRRFGMGLDSPAMKCWAVFWWVKHCVAFRQDEATMFRVGLQDEQDLLIEPAVLVRMKNPAEDCDGFTMLGAAMLSILGVPVYIATVAASPDDRSRWSHVFPVAVLPSGVLPLDMSHGVGPGWMIPRGHIFRWQAWGLDGRPANVPAPHKFQGLHGYVRRGRGMGACDPTIGLDDFTGLPCQVSQVPTESPYPVVMTPTSYGTQVQVPVPPGMDWTTFAQSLATNASKLIGAIVTPPAYQQVVRDAAGNIVSTTVRNASGATALTAGAGALSSSPIIWIGGGLLLAVVLASMSKSR